MAEHRQRERRLGDEHVARHRHEAGAGGIGGALVVAADHGARALVLHRHLGAAQHMPGRLQPDPHAAEVNASRPSPAPAAFARRAPRPAGPASAPACRQLASTARWPGRAWSECAWVITARSTARSGSMKKPPGSQYSPCGRTFSQVEGCGMRATCGARFAGRPARPNRTARPMAGTLPEPFAAWFAAQGWAPRRHQLAMLDAARAGESVLLIAPTGGGKTLAGFLPTLVALAEAPRAGLHTLYISPLKALATDIARNLMRPVEEMRLPVSIETRTGDTPANRRARQRARAAATSC